MDVIRAEVLGTCQGVRRALRIVEETLAAHPGTPVFTLGPIVHNPRVVEGLRRRGVVPISDPAAVERGIIVVRSHGVGPEVLRRCRRPGVSCVDATCTTVAMVHELVRTHIQRGGHVVIVGDPAHPEVEGIRGHAPGAAVISTEAGAEAAVLTEGTLVVSQTTFEGAIYRRIAAILRSRQPSLRVAETGCPATEQRQESLRELVGRVQAVVVVGGRGSANTTRLYQTAVSAGRPTWLVEGAAELPVAALRRFRTVGLTAGASTPDGIIDEVESALRAIAHA